ncbi:hypothetical protein ACWCOV_41760, partial [Kribbella sp. NPDC002412]
MLLTEVVETSAALAGTRSRLKKAEFIAGLLTSATDPLETEIAVILPPGADDLPGPVRVAEP